MRALLVPSSALRCVDAAVAEVLPELAQRRQAPATRGLDAHPRLVEPQPGEQCLLGDDVGVLARHVLGDLLAGAVVDDLDRVEGLLARGVLVAARGVDRNDVLARGSSGARGAPRRRRPP
jgi:hypothetical protein